MFVPLHIALLSWHEFSEELSSWSSEIYAFIVITSEDEVFGLQRTPPAECFGEDLFWHSTARFLVPSHRHDGQNIFIFLRQRNSRGEDALGYARIPLQDICVRASEISAPLMRSNFLFSCDVRKVDGEMGSGSLVLGLRLGEEEDASALRMESRRSTVKILFILFLGILVWLVLHFLAMILSALIQVMVKSQLPSILAVEALVLLLTRGFWRNYNRPD